MGIFDRSTQSMLFEANEEITFPDGTAANVGDIRLRSLSIRPQRSDKGDLFGVFNIVFIVKDIVVSDTEGEVHSLCNEDDDFARAFNRQVTTRVETEKWVPWARVPELMPLIAQMQQTGYTVESNRMSYAEVTEWFNENRKKTTFGKKDNSWLTVRSEASTTLLEAQFVGRIGEMQEGTTQSLYSGYDDLALLIEEHKEALESGKATDEQKREFSMLIGNVFGFHEDNDGARWGNKIAINSLTVAGQEYSLYFNAQREQVTDLDTLFDAAAQQIEQKEKVDVEQMFS